MSIKPDHRFLKLMLTLYALSTLVSMAVMSIAAVALTLTLVWHAWVTRRTQSDPIQSGPPHSSGQGHIPERLGWEMLKLAPHARRYFTASLVLMAAVAIGLVTAKLWPVHIGAHALDPMSLNAISKCWYLFWPLIIVAGLKQMSSNDREQILAVWLTGFGILSLLGIVQYYIGWPRPQPIPPELIRFHATLFLGHHLSVASIWIFPFFTALDLAWLSWLKKDLRKSSYYFIIALVGAITLGLTYSRALWVALPIGIGLWVLLRMPKKIAFLAVTGLTVACLSLIQIPVVNERIHNAMGLSTRQDLWEANWELFKSRPITGVGLRNNHQLAGQYLMQKHATSDVFTGHAHNNLLDFLGATGATGTLAWIYWCIVALGLLYKKTKGENPTRFWAGWTAAWMVFHLNGLTQVNFWEGKVQHQLAWILAWCLL